MKVISESGVNLLVPSYIYFVNKIKNEEQFNYSRAQHGEWDSLLEVYPNTNSLLSDINDQNWKKLSLQISKSAGYKTWHHPINSDVLSKFENHYRVIYENNNLLPDLHLGVTNDFGFGDIFRKKGANKINYEKRVPILIKFTEKSSKLYHAGIPRHMGVMDESYDFFKKLNDLDSTIIVVGPSYMKLFKDEFKIKNFHQISTPQKGAIHIIDDIVKDILLLSDKKKRVLVISSLGSTISTNLALGLKDTGISSFDVGRGFDWNLKKYKNNFEELGGMWLRQPAEGFIKYVKNIRK
jgi:hypothetical protein